MKRTWKPLDVGGLRLYEVIASRPRTDQPGRFVTKHFIVAGDSPSHAAELVKKCGYDGEWSILGRALNVLIPEAWWNEGAPFLSLIKTEADPKLIAPLDCTHSNQLMLHSSRGTGCDVRWDESAWLCRDCGQFEVRTMRNGQRSTVKFTLGSDEQIWAAIKHAQYLASCHS